MKKYSILLFGFLLLLLAGCVQKSYRKTVVIRLTVPQGKEVKSVGVRGEGKPLSWNADLALTPVEKDSLYTATISTVTGYKFAEIKFTVNGDFELKEKPNRRVMFSDKDTTYYTALFDSDK